MLHRLEVENFYSIREAQVIDLRADGHVPDDPDRLAPLWKGCAEKCSKVVAVFGPNASGKSNVLRAISFMAWFVQHSFGIQPNANLPFARFNDEESSRAPTRLAVHIAGIEDLANFTTPDAKQCRLRYEVVIGGGAQHVIQSEALYYWPSVGGRRVRLLERNENGKVKAAREFGLAGYWPALEKILRPNASVLATLAQLKHPLGTALWNASALVSSNILIEKFDNEDQIIRYYAANPKLVEVLNLELERVDFGIRAMELQAGPNGAHAFFRHEGLAQPLPLVQESHGTRQFLRLYPLLLRALETGGIAVLDELDTSIHPLLLPEILRWFYDPGRNPRNAQLWMSCHTVSLLEDLEKEEVLFCEKDKRGRTSVYSLRDIQAVRRNDNFYKKYLGGVYGAVPQIG
jgi:uncharacterized protein